MLGLDNFSNTEQVVSAFNLITLNYQNNQSPSDQEKANYVRVEQAFDTLVNEHTKKEYDNKLSAFLSNQVKSTKSKSNSLKQSIASTDDNPSKHKYTNTAIIIIGLLASGVYFFQQKNNAPQYVEQPVIVKPQSEQTVKAKSSLTNASIFLNEFASESQRQRSATLYFGLLGSPEIGTTVAYPQEQLLDKVTTTPTGEPFPAFTNVLSSFPTYSYGESKLTLKNPTKENAFVKVIYLDGEENFAIRHAYILGGEQITLTGLPEGAVQVGVLFPNHPQIAFLTQQYKVFNDAENSMPIYGQKVETHSIF